MDGKLTIEPIKRSTLTANEVAEYLGISTDTVYKLAREKVIPHVKIGQRVLFKKDRIDRWMDMREQEAMENVF